MRHSGIILGIVISSLSACSSTKVTTGYYEIKGSTSRDLDRSIARNAPMQGHAFAATQLQILPVQLKPKLTSEGCSLREAKFRVVAKITMPRWTQRSGASKDLSQGFDMFADYARLHEQVHVRIGEAAASTMEAAVMEVPPQKDCDRLAAKVKQAVDKVQRDHNKAQLAFDASEDKRLRALFAKAN